ncbi:Pilus assembly protein, PilO [Curtobacterium sp. UNCCL20]|uniref:type 4a pilus biogenesis protein PilO n=1 Tax=Curtobacterium sp. UNCCL20 TaxID=1502773 RepID=UPI0008847A7B|nr:type 4a pilus biogenesis protein PilO [Curtobacterium sp. UNCCL20]SDQ09421.1 Pilus assembly protein, PilO [Curtobacterium sp. UNCCL20]
MSRNRMSLILALLAMAAVAVGGFFLAVQPQLTQAAVARTQTETVNQSNDANRTELARLKTQAAKLPAMKQELSSLTASVPADADVPAFINELDSVAAASGMQVSSFTSGDATAYAPAAAATNGSAAAGSTAAPSASAEPSASATAAAPAAPTAPSVVTNAAITGQNFSIIPVTVAVDGSFDQALSFVKGVQNGQRLFLITTIASAEKSGDDGGTTSSSTWTFGGFIYVLDTTPTPAAATSTNG